MAVTHPGTNAHNCSLTSSKVHTTIYPLGHWYLRKESSLTPTVTRIPSSHYYASRRKTPLSKGNTNVLYRNELNYVYVLNRQVLDRGGGPSSAHTMHAQLCIRLTNLMEWMSSIIIIKTKGIRKLSLAWKEEKYLNLLQQAALNGYM